MIRRFRYQVVTVIVALFALALGIALGAGPLADSQSAAGEDRGANQSAEDKSAGDHTSGDTSDQVGEKLAIGFARDELKGSLDGDRIAILAMPGSESEQVKDLDTWIRLAGGTVTGTFTATEKLLDADGKSLVDLLGTQLAEPLGRAVPDDSTTYDRMGRVIGAAIASPAPRSSGGGGGSGTDNSPEPDLDILSGLDAAKLMKADAEPTQRADLVLVVLGDSESSNLSADKIYAPLLSGLDASTGGTVVAGGHDDELLAELRGGQADGDSDGDSDGDTRAERLLGPRTSSTDSVELRSGRIIAVQTLAAASDGTFGDYGKSGADGTTP